MLIPGAVLARGIALLAVLTGCAHSPVRTDSGGASEQSVNGTATLPSVASAAGALPVPAHVDFSRDIRPILESRCQPCHFPGGKMYERLPFDQAATIRTLGPKLFTRIKADDEQALFRSFLAQVD